MRESHVVLIYAATIFLSAFLLFQVQPLVSKFILPWFGGSPAVWTAAMLFFQLVLFGGYLYAHLTSTYLGARGQFITHLLLLALALTATLVTQITPPGSLRPTGDAHESPLLQVLLLLGYTVGVPYFCLSATGPLLQKWFSDAFEGASPYRLFALSNLGSLLALLSYPFFFEVYWNNRTLAWFWSGGFVMFGLSCALAATFTYLARRRQPQPIGNAEGTTVAAHGSELAPIAPPTWSARFAWTALPTLASIMFLATTNEVCQNIATVPLLWIVPLSLYLISFIIAFDHPRWYSPWFYAAAACVLLLIVAGYDDISGSVNGGLNSLLRLEGDRRLRLDAAWWLEGSIYFAALFLVVVMCHGELARCKPHPRYLTEYFLTMSLGGALGGILINLGAPYVFKTFFEFPLALLLSLALAVHVGFYLSANFYERATWVGCGLVALLCTASWRMADSFFPEAKADATNVHLARNFYGTVRVAHRGIGTNDENFTFYSGHITHGKQFALAERRAIPLTYYGETSGAGIALNYLKSKHPKLHIGVVGLGVGTLATYARQADKLRYYEINPEVVTIAQDERWFHFWKDCPAEKQIIVGDARLQLERELRGAGSHQFDFLCIDAFSGDAIPAHLLTTEAIALYKEHLHPRGILAIHMTNTYLDLYPVVKTLAAAHGFQHTRLYVPISKDGDLYRNYYALLTNDTAFLAQTPEQIDELPEYLRRPRKLPLWTDDYNNLLPLLR